MNLGIEGKYAIVTGGSHGIGRSIALALANSGCNVAICSRDKEKLTRTVEELKKKGNKSIGVSADVLVPSDIEHVMNTVVDAWGTVHILVNNVGGGGRWGSPVVEETSEQVWIDVYNKNTMAAIRFVKLAIPYMRKQKWGRVVTISSICGRESDGRPWFIVAKHSEVALMKSLARNHTLARSGITFNSVCPGAIMIPGSGWDLERENNPDKVTEFIESLPLGRMGTPEEVANVVLFLCSEKAGFVNGASIVVDGGESKVI